MSFIQKLFESGKLSEKQIREAQKAGFIGTGSQLPFEKKTSNTPKTGADIAGKGFPVSGIPTTTKESLTQISKANTKAVEPPRLPEVQGFRGNIGTVGDRPTNFKPSRVVPKPQIKESAFVIVGGLAIPKEALGGALFSSADNLPEGTNPVIRQEQEFTRSVAEKISQERLNQLLKGKSRDEAQRIATKGTIDEREVSKSLGQVPAITKQDQLILNTLLQKDQIGKIDSINIQTEGGEDISPRRTKLLLENALITGQNNFDVTFSPLDDIVPNVDLISEQIRQSQKENLGLELPTSLTPTGGTVGLTQEQFNDFQKQVSELVAKGAPEIIDTDPANQVSGDGVLSGILSNPFIPLLIFVGIVGAVGLALVGKKK